MRTPHVKNKFFIQIYFKYVVAVQSLSYVWLFAPMDCSTPGFPVHHQLTELAQTYVDWVIDVIQPSHLLLSPSFPVFSLFQIRVFSNESALPDRWLKYWSINFSTSPFNEYSGLNFFRIDWFDLIAVQGTLKSLLQHPTVQKHQFFGAQPSLQSNSYIHMWLLEKPSIQFSSVAQLCLNLCDPMDCSTSGLPVHHQLLEFTQTNVHWVSDAIQPSHSLSLPFILAFNLSQHQGLFKWVSFSHQVAKVLEFHL